MDRNSFILQNEKIVLDRVLKTSRRNDLLQIGGPSDGSLIENVRASRAFFLNRQEPFCRQKPCVQSALDEMPIRTESMDIVLCVHALEHMRKCDEVLQEIFRILKPDGKVVLCGFNRWSVWRLFHPAKVTRLYSVNTLKRALQSVGFDIELQQTLCFWPSARGRKRAALETFGQFLLPYSGAVYMIVAKKNVEGMTPLFESVWMRKVVSHRTVEPSTRSFYQ